MIVEKAAVLTMSMLIVLNLEEKLRMIQKIEEALSLLWWGAPLHHVLYTKHRAALDMAFRKYCPMIDQPPSHTSFIVE